MMQPLITVVLAVQDRESYVAETIESIVKQRHELIELIVVDDCSYDHSNEVILKMLYDPMCSERFSNIIHKRFNKRRGIPKALNWGLSNGKGDFLTVIIAGDQYPQDRLERLGKSMRELEVEWAFTRVGVIDSDGFIDEESDEQKRCSRIQARVGKHRSVAFTSLSQHLTISPGALFLTRDLFKDAGRFRSLPHSFDWDFFLRASLISEPAYFPHITYYKRKHIGNEIRKIDKSEMREGPIALRRFFSLIQTDNVQSLLIAENEEFIKEFERESMRMGLHDIWKTTGNPNDVFQQAKLWIKDNIS